MNHSDIIFWPEYGFLLENEHLGSNIILLAMCGSHAYGTNVPGSDIDLRGVAVERPNEVFGMHSFESFTDSETDSSFLSLRRAMHLFSRCTPGWIELLGCRPEDYVYISKHGQLLIDNRQIFLSQLAAVAFGGYAKKTLKRTEKHAVENGPVEKHRTDKALMHQARLRMMLLDLLEKEEVIVYREKEHDLLMNIRGGMFTDSKGHILPEFYEFQEEWDRRLAYAEKATSLPLQPDHNAIENLLMEIYRDRFSMAWRG